MYGWLWTFAFTFVGLTAHAGCISPPGVAGQIRYTSPNLTFCDGYAWSNTDSSVTATSCTTAGQIKLVGSNIRFCNGSFWVDTVGSLTNGTCSTTGDLIYSPTKNWMQSCNGTNWIPLGKTAPTVTTKLAQYFASPGTSFSLPAFSGTVAAGDAIVCRSYMATSAGVTSVSDNKGSTYTRLIAPFNDNQGLREELWAAENTPGGSGLVVSVVRTGTGTTVTFECIDVNGVVATNVVDQVTKASGTTDTAAGTTVTTTSARELNLRVGYTENIALYRGHIGYTVFESFRGRNFAARSCRLLRPVLAALKLSPVWITCNVDNAASAKSIEKIGATFVGVQNMPDDYPHKEFYPPHARRKNLYRWDAL